MKIVAILLMIISVIALFGFGLMYLLGFAMSFDAPGSQSDPKAWGMRFLMFFTGIISDSCFDFIYFRF